MRKISLLLVAADAALTVLALVTAYFVRFGVAPGFDDLFSHGGARVLVVAGIVIITGFFCELYRLDQAYRGTDLLARIAVTMLLSMLILSAFYYLVPEAMIGRGILSLSLISCGAMQFLLRRGLVALGGLSGFAQRVLVLGVGPLAEVMQKTILLSQGRYLLAGFVQPAADIMTVPCDQVIGQVDRIRDLVREQRASKVVVAITERRGVLPVKDLLFCKLSGIDVLDSPSFYEMLTGKLLIENIQPSWFIYSNGFRINSFKKFYKRAGDVLFSMFGVFLALPLFPLVAMLIKLDSSGPILFRQVRVGERGKEFSILKFRTMRQDAEKETGAVWASKNDPRITRIGGFLRKSRLDELPQLFNVLRGEMSFVGPRPERPEFVGQLSEKIPYYEKRHFVKPGLTGWAQVCYPYGSSEQDALEKLRYDLYYIKNYSLILDLFIVLETIKVVLYNRGGR
ncbi:MAG: TIGR03013 family PEP-CTERM/XrtA system glycosyltransferase [Syntrophotaleaceae bacterium]